MSDSIPRLRTDLELIPTSYQGEQAVLVKDALGLVPEPILLQGPGLEILGLIDGRRDLRDIQLAFMRARGNAFVSAQELQEVLSRLDEAYLLDSPRFQEAKARVEAAYERETVRTAGLAGKAYPADGDDLSAFLDEFFTEEAERVVPAAAICGLVAPHIDLGVGKRVYQQAYTAIKGINPGRILLLGTGHSLREGYFALTEKDFITPLGRVSTDKDAAAAAASSAYEIVSPTDIAHRSEHSLEFQLIFLQHILESGFSILPVLCGSFQQELDSYSRPGEIPGIAEFLETLKSWLREDDSSLIVAGVDFSHIGQKFGHTLPAASLKSHAREHDHRLIDALIQGDVAGFWRESRQVQDRFHVCGFSAMACLLELLPGGQGHLLGYEFWDETATLSAVSYAAVALTRG